MFFYLKDYHANKKLVNATLGACLTSVQNAKSALLANPKW
jgi:hypothetical protein